MLSEEALPRDFDPWIDIRMASVRVEDAASASFPLRCAATHSLAWSQRAAPGVSCAGLASLIQIYSLVLERESNPQLRIYSPLLYR